MSDSERGELARLVSAVSHTNGQLERLRGGLVATTALWMAITVLLAVLKW